MLTYNAALNRPAYQPSVYATFSGRYPASLANDGSHETDPHKDGKPHCAFTQSETNPWWAVDLGHPTTVYRVDLTNSHDVFGNVIMTDILFHSTLLS